MAFAPEPSFINVMANPAAADLTYATLHYDDPTGGGNRSDTGAQAISVTNTGGTLTLDSEVTFTGTPSAAATYIGLWHGNPSSGGTYRGYIDNEAPNPVFNGSGSCKLTAFSFSLAAAAL